MKLKEWKVPHTGFSEKRRMQDNEFSIVFIKGSYYKLMVNQKLSNIIIEKDLNYLSVAQDEDTGDVIFMFNKDKGMKLSHTGRLPYININLNSKEWMDKLHDVYKLERGVKHVLILSDNKSQSDNLMFFKIKGVKY